MRTLKHDIVSENFNLIARHTYCTYQFEADELAKMPRTLASLPSVWSPSSDTASSHKAVATVGRYLKDPTFQRAICATMMPDLLQVCPWGQPTST